MKTSQIVPTAINFAGAFALVAGLAQAVTPAKSADQTMAKDNTVHADTKSGGEPAGTAPSEKVNPYGSSQDMIQFVIDRCQAAWQIPGCAYAVSNSNFNTVYNYFNDLIEAGAKQQASDIFNICRVGALSDWMLVTLKGTEDFVPDCITTIDQAVASTGIQPNEIQYQILHAGIPALYGSESTQSLLDARLDDFVPNF